MKHRNQLLSAGLAALLMLSLAACGGTPANTDSTGKTTEQQAPTQAEMTVYDAPSGTFAISVPEIEGGWSQTDGGNDYHLVLDNSDKSFTLMLQALPMEDAQKSIADLDTLIELYRQTTLGSFGEPTSTEIAIGDPAIEGAKADAYEVEQGGNTAKALVSYFQTDKDYYVCILTGTGEAYDANIDQMKAALTTFTEKA